MYCHSWRIHQYQHHCYRSRYVSNKSIMCFIILLAGEVIFISTVKSGDTNVTFTWTPASGVPVTTYNISYYNTNKKCFFDNRTISVGNETLIYTLQVQEWTKYSVKVEVLHEGRAIGSNETLVTTKPVGTYCECFDATTNYGFVFSSICWSLFCECG